MYCRDVFVSMKNSINTIKRIGHLKGEAINSFLSSKFLSWYFSMKNKGRKKKKKKPKPKFFFPLFLFLSFFLSSLQYLCFLSLLFWHRDIPTVCTTYRGWHQPMQRLTLVLHKLSSHSSCSWWGAHVYVPHLFGDVSYKKISLCCCSFNF